MIFLKLVRPYLVVFCVFLLGLIWWFYVSLSDHIRSWFSSGHIWRCCVSLDQTLFGCDL